MENNLKKLVGQSVVKSSAGGAAGSILVVEFEDTSYFFIWCAWRIQKGNEVIVTSSDTVIPTEECNNSGGYISEYSSVLEGKKLLEYVVLPQYDLKFNFDNGYSLNVFCDIGHSRIDYNMNWELIIPPENKSIEISNHFEQHIVKESTD